MFLDAYGRLIMGWAIWTFPSAPSVLAALGKAIRLDPERGPFGGVPLTLRPDNGLEIRCGLARQGRRCACCTLAPTRAYSPHLKGKLERANRTVTQEFVAGLPFYTDGPRTIDGRLYGPNTSPMTLEQFVEKFDRWVRAHCLLLVRQAVQQQRVDSHRAHSLVPAKVIGLSAGKVGV
jgi:putative transposase